MLRSNKLTVDDLKRKTLILPNNFSMREWKGRANVEQVVRAHIKKLPLAKEYDKTTFGNLTRTWSIPLKFKTLGSVGVIVPLVLSAEVHVSTRPVSKHSAKKVSY